MDTEKQGQREYRKCQNIMVNLKVKSLDRPDFWWT